MFYIKNKRGGEIMNFDDEYVQMLREKYPEGTRIVLDQMNDDPRPIAPGTAGTVRVVDDMGTIHCDFDDGRRLGLVPGEDEFHIEKERYIKVVLCEPGKKARITTVSNDLKSLQHMVGDSLIECVYPFDDPVAIICDEEGKLRNAELNRSLKDDQGKIYDILAGPFLVVGLSDDDFASLSKEHQGKYCKLFEYPEIFLRMGNEIHAVKVETQERPRTSKRR